MPRNRALVPRTFTLLKAPKVSQMLLEIINVKTNTDARVFINFCCYRSQGEWYYVCGLRNYVSWVSKGLRKNPATEKEQGAH